MFRRTVVTGFIKKEFRQMFRDIRMWVVLVGSPLFLLLLFGYAVNLDVKDVRMAYLDRDKTAQSRELVERFTASKYFIPVAALPYEDEADKLLDKGTVEFVLLVPDGFSRRIKSGKASEVQILIDGTDSGRASVTVSYVNEIVSAFSLKYFGKKVVLSVLSRGKAAQTPKMKKNVELKERVLYNQNLSSRNFYLPGILSLIISLITVTLTAMSIVKEREMGTIDQIAVSPISSYELIAGKTIPFIIVSFFDTILITCIMIFWFRVPFNGSFLFLLLASLVFVISTTAVGLFISTISKTQQQALLSVFLFFMPATMFGGFAFPLYVMPQSIMWISYINPMQYYIKIIRAIFLKGAGPIILGPDILALAAIGAVLFFLSSRRFSRRME
jgi:ABC-2 type transport system permease protein